MNTGIEQQAEIAKQFFEKIFIEFKLKRYQAYSNSEDCDEYEFDTFECIEWEDLDPKQQHFEDVEDLTRSTDGISMYVYKIPIQDLTTITYRMETDGDDGWIVIFNDIGELLAFGYTYH